MHFPDIRNFVVDDFESELTSRATFDMNQFFLIFSQLPRLISTQCCLIQKKNNRF